MAKKKKIGWLTSKDRDSIWLDIAGTFWFWSAPEECWSILASGVDPQVEPGFTPCRPYFAQRLGQQGWETHGPFTRVGKANYEEKS